MLLMFVTLMEFYVRAFATLLPVLAAAGIAVSAQRAAMPWKSTITIIALMGLVWGVWYALASWMGELDLLMPPETITGTPYILFFLFGGTALLVLLGRLTQAGRVLTDAADQKILIGFQIPRVMGFVFLVGWATGDISWQFALPAGAGDILAGIAGWQAYQALERGQANATALVWRANIIGLLDFLVAILTGVMTSEGFAHVLAAENPNIINHYPLVLFPAFFVPIFLAAHVFSIAKLRQQRVAQTSPA
ncbi:MAG: hypothetical protein ABJL55_15630 [Roseibium sp.]